MTGQVPPYPNFSQQQQTQIRMTDQSPSDVKIAALEVRIGGVEDGIKHIVSKLDQREKTPWGMIFTAGGVVITLITAIGGLAFNPLNSGINDLKAVMVKFEGKTDGFMKREDIEAQVNGLRSAVGEKFAVSTERRNDLQAKTDERIARAEKDVSKLQDDLVSRREHESYRALQTRDYDLLRNRLDRVEARFEKRSDGLDHAIGKLGDETLSRSEAITRNDAQDRANGFIRRELDEHVRAFNERQQRTIDRLETTKGR